LAPQIGNNVYIGPGAKIFGEIVIADNIAIGANSVVNKSFYEKGISIAGVPAKKINTKGTDDIIVTATQIVKNSLRLT
jgi:serine O-acetyltransferase